MAGTFAINVKTLWRTNLPQAGMDSTGASKNVKQQVCAIVTITYADTLGSTMKPKDLGLRTFDHVAIYPISSGATVNVVASRVTVEHTYGTNVILGGVTTISDGVNTQTAGDAALVFRVLAVGDSAFGDELL